MFKKRILTLFLILCLALLLFPMKTYAADGKSKTVTSAKELAAALSDTSVKHITISKKVSVEKPITIPTGKTIVITKSGSLGFSGTESNKLTIKNDGTIQVDKKGSLLIQNAVFTNSKTGKITVNGEIFMPMSQLNNKGTIDSNGILSIFPSASLTNAGKLVLQKNSTTIIKWGGQLKNTKSVTSKSKAELFHFGAITGYTVSKNPGVYIFNGKKWVSDGYPERPLEEKIDILSALNGGEYSSSTEPLTMAELIDLMVNAYGLDETYVRAKGDGDPNTPDNAFFDFGFDIEDNAPLMRGNFAYVIVKLYKLSASPIDSSESWKHIDQSGYLDVDVAERGYPGNKEAIYLCKKLGIEIPEVSKTELGFQNPVTKVEFAIAAYSALGKKIS